MSETETQVHPIVLPTEPAAAERVLVDVTAATSTHARVAVAMRATQHELDEAAFDVGGRRFTTVQCDDLAAALEDLAGIVHRYRATHAPVPVDDDTEAHKKR